MGKIIFSAAVGIAIAALLMAAPVLGLQLSPAFMTTLAAALSVGAAAAVLTRLTIDRPKPKNEGAALLGKRLKDVKELIALFPKGGGAVQLSIRSETAIDELEVVKNPTNYVSKDIVVALRDGGKTFNPVTLKKLFIALKDQPNFLHLLLLDKHDEFVGYIPSFRVKSEFTGGNAEGQISRYVIDPLADHAKSVNLRQIDGLGNTETISDEAKISEALARAGGGYYRLVVLRGGRHRKPVGLLLSEQLLGLTKPMSG